MNVLAAGAIFEIISVHHTFLYGGLQLNPADRPIQKIWNYCLQLLPLKMWRDSTKHHYSPDVCKVLAYISVLEIWLLVQALSWEAPLRVKVYFQCAYLYSACLNREAKWSKIFPAIRPGNWGLQWIKIPFSPRYRWTYPSIATVPKINIINATLHVLNGSIWWWVGF